MISASSLDGCCHEFSDGKINTLTSTEATRMTIAMRTKLPTVNRRSDRHDGHFIMPYDSAPGRRELYYYYHYYYHYY